MNPTALIAPDLMQRHLLSTAIRAATWPNGVTTMSHLVTNFTHIRYDCETFMLLRLEDTASNYGWPEKHAGAITIMSSKNYHHEQSSVPLHNTDHKTPMHRCANRKTSSRTVADAVVLCSQRACAYPWALRVNCHAEALQRMRPTPTTIIK
jgi:hypothetical protein